MKQVCFYILLFVVAVTYTGCASRQVNLAVDVHNRSTHAPVEGAIVTAEYIPPILRSKPAQVTERTGSSGEALLVISKKDYPLTVRVSAPGHKEHKIPTYINQITSDPKWYSPQTVTVEKGTLDVRLHVVIMKE